MLLFEEVEFIEGVLTAKIAIVDNEFDYRYVISKFVSGVLQAKVPAEIIVPLDSGSTYRMIVVSENDTASIILSKEK
jgi:hypothetical protein